MTRGSPLSKDLREVLIYMGASRSKREVACVTGLPPRTVYDILTRYDKTGRVTPSPTRKIKDKGTKMGEGEFNYLLEILNQTPTTYLGDMQKMLKAAGVGVHTSTIWRHLKQHGYSMKKPIKAAKERSFTLRTRYINTISQYKRRSLVFIDESSFDRRASICTRAWAKIGERVINKIPFLRGRRFSILPAISTSGILHVNIVEGSFDMELFNTFIEQLLLVMNPWDEETHPPNSVIVLDNCKIHKDSELVARVEERGMKIVFLPPYSPDYNPIEKAFSLMKIWFKKNYNLVGEAWNDNEHPDRAPNLVLGLADHITPAHTRAWFKDCGYVEDEFGDL